MVLVRSDSLAVARGARLPPLDTLELGVLLTSRMRAGGPLAEISDIELARELARLHAGIPEESRAALRVREVTIEEMAALFEQIDRRHELKALQDQQFRELIREMARVSEGPARGRR